LDSPGTLSEVLATRSSEIADAVANAVARHVIRSSACLTAEHDRRRLMQVQMIKRVLEVTASDETFSAGDLRSYEDLGMLFARHCAPLSLLVASFDVGAAEITRESWRIAPAERFAEMTQFTKRAALVLEQTRQAAIGGYLAARAGSDGQSMRRIVAEALIAGESAPAAAQAIGERLAPGYLVLACTVPDPAQVDAGQLAAIHRDIDGIPGALHCGNLSTLVILLPVEDSRPLPEAAAAELAGRLRSLTRQLVLAGQAYRTDLAGIPAALEEARRALALVKAIPDADCRPYRMDELLVELAIARQPDIRQRLTILLAPLDGGTDLQRTLEALFACNLDRERAAKELRIHRRTLRYRMDRIRDLSGIDPDSAHGIQLLRAALTATRLPAVEPGEAPCG
jgi:PucR C-terminal helix-turn-helix domain/GGDEF-like domain